MLEITWLGVSLSHRIKGLQAVFGQLSPFLLMLILGIPAQAMTAVLLCSHHAFRLTARPGSSHSRCGRRAQPLSDPQLILPGMTLESGQGNVKFWLVQFPLQGVEVIFSPFRELIRNNSLPKHRLISTLKSELGILHVFKKKCRELPQDEPQEGAVCWEAASSPCPSQEMHFSSWHIHFGTPTPTQQSLCRHPLPLDTLQMLIQSLPFSLSHMEVTAILFLLQFWKGMREKWVFFMFQEDRHLSLSWQQLLCWGRGDAQSSWRGNGAGCKCLDCCW